MVRIGLGFGFLAWVRVGLGLGLVCGLVWVEVRVKARLGTD